MHQQGADHLLLQVSRCPLYSLFVTESLTVHLRSLIVMQWANLLSTRTRRLSIFTQSPFGKKTGNWYLFPAMAISLCIGM